jgi:hypothetical protein
MALAAYWLLVFWAHHRAQVLGLRPILHGPLLLPYITVSVARP